MTFTGLALGGATMAAVAVLGEVPSGYAGDRLGRRRSLLLSQTLFAVGISAWAFVQSTAGVVAVFAVVVVASAFQSGSTEAWLYDTLDEGHGSESDLRTGRGSRRLTGRATGRSERRAYGRSCVSTGSPTLRPNSSNTSRPSGSS